MIFVHRATWSGCSSDIRCLSAATSHKCGGANPVSDSYRVVRRSSKWVGSWGGGGGGLKSPVAEESAGTMDPYLDTNLLVYTLLLVFDLFLDGLDRSGVWCGAICFEYLNVPTVVNRYSPDFSARSPYSSVRGVIFFSGISSSAKSFLYFSQELPVAEGMLTRELY